MKLEVIVVISAHEKLLSICREYPSRSCQLRARFFLKVDTCRSWQDSNISTQGQNFSTTTKHHWHDCSSLRGPKRVTNKNVQDIIYGRAIHYGTSNYKKKANIILAKSHQHRFNGRVIIKFYDIIMCNLNRDVSNITSETYKGHASITIEVYLILI